MRQYIRLRKTAATDNPRVATPAWEDHQHGLDSQQSLPLDYEVTGILQESITVGQPIRMFRETRNGVQCLGIFQSSTVTKMEGDKVWTLNSVYTILELRDLEITMAPTDRVEKLDAELDELLPMLGLREALVTDESTIGDFSFLTPEKTESLRLLIGCPIAQDTLVVDVLEHLRNRKS